MAWCRTACTYLVSSSTLSELLRHEILVATKYEFAEYDSCILFRVTEATQADLMAHVPPFFT